MPPIGGALNTDLLETLLQLHRPDSLKIVKISGWIRGDLTKSDRQRLLEPYQVTDRHLGRVCVKRGKALGWQILKIHDQTRSLHRHTVRTTFTSVNKRESHSSFSFLVRICGPLGILQGLLGGQLSKGDEGGDAALLLRDKIVLSGIRIQSLREEGSGS